MAHEPLIHFTEASLKDLCLFTIVKIWKFGQLTQDCSTCAGICDDLSQMIKTSREPKAVMMLFIYYVAVLRAVCFHSKLEIMFNARTMYIVAMFLAIKYVDDYRSVKVNDWSQFANVSKDTFLFYERNILRYLGYSMYPGNKRLNELLIKLQTASVKRPKILKMQQQAHLTNHHPVFPSSSSASNHWSSLRFSIEECCGIPTS